MYTGSFGPASNRAVYSETIQLRASDDEVPPAVEEIEMTIGGGSRSSSLTKTLTGETIIYNEDLGEFSFSFSESEMNRFSAGSYPMGIKLTIAGVVEQLFTGEIIIVEGVVA